MALAKKKIHTTEDIYQLPEGDRAELIDGDLYMMSPAQHHASTDFSGIACRDL